MLNSSVWRQGPVAGSSKQDNEYSGSKEDCEVC
jgi:hypothetical protein